MFSPGRIFFRLFYILLRLFCRLLWKLGNYVIRNPYARRAVGLGCLILLLIQLAIGILSAILAAIGYD
jgi:hypothetical protein